MLSKATWKVAEPQQQRADLLIEELGCSQVMAHCLVNRDLSTLESTQAYLNPKLGDLDPPDQMVDLEKAAIRTVKAVMERENIGVFGDYDVDGVTSAVLVTSFLRELGAHVEVELADRFTGGYGLGAQTVEEIYGRGCSLLVVLDCGTSDHEAMTKASSLGMDVIVIDHHRIENKHPDVYAFVNPNRKDCEFADKTMAAVGLAFYFVAAVRSRMVKKGFIERDSIDPRSLLDMVALGTIADVVSLKGNNRILASHGLKQLSRNRKPGLSALMASARIRSRKLRSDHISYQLAPRINAAGRLATASEAFKLLISSDRRESIDLAEMLGKLTTKRREIEEEVTNSARLQVQEHTLYEKAALVVYGEGWHRGVIGIVAARLAEEYSRPTYVISFDEGIGTGSARAQGQINLYGSLLSASDSLARYGGHKDAAGFSIHYDKRNEFIEAVIDYASRETLDFEPGEIICDALLNPAQLSPVLLNELESMGPFGNGNPEPIFDIVGLDVLNSRIVGKNHLKLELKTPSGSISAFGPRMAAYVDNMPHMIRVAASLTVDEWKGDGSPELRLVAPPVKYEI